MQCGCYSCYSEEPRGATNEDVKPHFSRWHCTIAIGILACLVPCLAPCLALGAALAQADMKSPLPPEPFVISATTIAASLASSENELRGELVLRPESTSTLYKLGLVLRLENKPKESLETYTKVPAAKARC